MVSCCFTIISKSFIILAFASSSDCIVRLVFFSASVFSDKVVAARPGMIDGIGVTSKGSRKARLPGVIFSLEEMYPPVGDHLSFSSYSIVGSVASSSSRIKADNGTPKVLQKRSRFITGIGASPVRHRSRLELHIEPHAFSMVLYFIFLFASSHL